jgi:glycosyltransferase involved in cell wall biosynthesis
MQIEELAFVQRSALRSWFTKEDQQIILGELGTVPTRTGDIGEFLNLVKTLQVGAANNDSRPPGAYEALGRYASALEMFTKQEKRRVLVVSTASILTPPDKYGGMERLASYFADALGAMGHTVGVLAKKGSTQKYLVGTATDERDFPNIAADLLEDYDVVVDFSHDKNIGRAFTDFPQLNVYQVMTVDIDGPVIYYGLEHEDYPVKDRPADPPYVIYMGSIIREKRVEWAVAIAEIMDIDIKIAGPSWQPDYMDKTVRPLFEREGVEYVGDVGGGNKLDLLQGASALVHPVGTPDWVEAGAIIVQEALSVGTPVIASYNGCLPEYIVDGDNGVLGDTPGEMAAKGTQLLAAAPSPEEVRGSIIHLSSLSMAWDYLDLINDVVAGDTW